MRALECIGLLLACAACARATPAPPVADATPNPSAPAPTPTPPRRVRHPGVAVELTDGKRMRESAPYLEPDTARRPVTVILHALCADEIWMCDWLQYGELSPQWQVCPRGTITCPNGGAQWTTNGEAIVRQIEAAIAKTRERHGARVGDDLVLVGMSQGAYAVAHVLRELARRPSLPIRGVVLHGAHVEVSAADAKKLGIRIVLAAGDQDAAAPAMRALAARLSAEGVEARYASFGDVGHFLPVDSAKVMVGLIAWARNEP